MLTNFTMDLEDTCGGDLRYLYLNSKIMGYQFLVMVELGKLKQCLVIAYFQKDWFHLFEKCIYIDMTMYKKLETVYNYTRLTEGI